MRAGDAIETPGDASEGGLWSLVNRILLRRLWLPSSFYAAIPWIYIVAGSGSLLGGLFLPEGAWPLPYLVLLGIACLHAGVAVASMRHRVRGDGSNGPDAR